MGGERPWFVARSGTRRSAGFSTPRRSFRRCSLPPRPPAPANGKHVFPSDFPRASSKWGTAPANFAYTHTRAHDSIRQRFIPSAGSFVIRGTGVFLRSFSLSFCRPSAAVHHLTNDGKRVESGLWLAPALHRAVCFHLLTDSNSPKHYFPPARVLYSILAGFKGLSGVSSRSRTFWHLAGFLKHINRNQCPCFKKAFAVRARTKERASPRPR